MKQQVNIIGIMSGLILLLLIGYLPHHHHDGMPCYDFTCIHELIVEDSDNHFMETEHHDDECEELCCKDITYIVQNGPSVCEAAVLKCFSKSNIGSIPFIDIDKTDPYHIPKTVTNAFSRRDSIPLSLGSNPIYGLRAPPSLLF